MKDNPSFNWTSLITYLDPQWNIKLPVYGIMVFHLICKTVTANCLFVPQFLMVIVVLSMARACNQIKRDMDILSEMSTIERQVFVVRQSRLQFRKIKSLIIQINEVFSVVALVSCLRDLMTCICLIATLLSRMDRDEDESREEFANRYNNEQFGRVFVYSQSATELGNAFFRLSASLYCYAQVFW
jgi:hypothetical protein